VQGAAEPEARAEASGTLLAAAAQQLVGVAGLRPEEEAQG